MADWAPRWYLGASLLSFNTCGVKTFCLRQKKSAFGFYGLVFLTNRRLVMKKAFIDAAIEAAAHNRAKTLANLIFLLADDSLVWLREEYIPF